ncbi:MAG: glycine cleavage system protein GcvH [Gammaproteobacteria bacterium]|nr:glycine cleavage system protein GcvH [Gammaproteobacteria bacterium]
MTMIPDDLRYTKDHEWVREEGDGEYTVGITDHAQSALGDLVFVELPEVGAEVEAGVACCVVESVKAASDVYSPLSGEVTEINDALVESPELGNSDPYTEGWLFRLRSDDTEALDALLDFDEYVDLLAAEED